MKGMNVTIEIPERIAQALAARGANVQRRVLEMLAIDGYRTGELSRGQVGEMLSLSFYETEELLHKHNVERGPTVAEYEEDAARFQKILAR